MAGAGDVDGLGDLLALGIDGGWGEGGGLGYVWGWDKSG